MKAEDIIATVEVERLYDHVLNIEGPRHPLDAPQELEKAADYIISEFERYGLTTNIQEFHVEDYDKTFRNVEGIIGNGTEPELLIIAHYDTVPNSPGANDNGSALSIMLETARILVQGEWSGNARFIGVSLEEASNPIRVLKERMLAQDLGLKDERDRVTSWHTAKTMKMYSDLDLSVRLKDEIDGYPNAGEEATSEIKEQLGSEELRYFKDMMAIYDDITITNWPGKVALLGSSFWVDKALQINKKVKGVLCLETVGYTSKEEHSQRFPKGMSPQLFRIFGTDEGLTIGDFLVIIGDQNSGPLAESFYAQCKLDSINLPSACLQEAFSYEEAAQIMPDILRSDHAPFWRAGIPALILTDSANFRYPYYHTQADTIDKLDFDFIAKVCKATTATVIDFT